MACVNISGTVTRSGTLTGSCTLSVEIRRDGIVLATVPVVALDNNVFPYAYQDTTAATSHLYTAKVLANACGCTMSTANFEWSITACVAPTVTANISPTTATVNTAYNGTITLANATSATVSGLPTGLTASALAGNTITITGTPTVTGPFTISVSATNACASGTASGPVTRPAGTLTVNSAACANPVFVGGGFFPSVNRCGTTINATANVGDTITAASPGAWQYVSSVNVTVSSPDLTITGNNGLGPTVSGTLTAPGVYTATFNATSDQGCFGCVVVMRWTVAGASCTTNWSLSQTTFVADTNTPVTYSATGIPAGCSLVLRPYNGGAPLLFGGVWPSIILTDTSPSVTTNNNWGAVYVGQPINWKPDPTQSSCLTCAVTPSQVNLTIVAQGGGPAALVLNACVPPGTQAVQEVGVTNSTGMTADLQVTYDSGVTWTSYVPPFTVPNNGLFFAANGPNCPLIIIVSAPAGTFRRIADPVGQLFRLVIGGTPVPF